MKINKNNAAILLCLFFHINVFAQQKPQSFFVSNDTVISKLSFCNGVFEKGFSSIGNIWFSQDYEIRDSFSIFINKDKIPDKIVILSPIVLRKYDLDTSYSDCVKSKFARRLFVVLIGIGDNNYKIGLIKDDLILNPYEVAWHDPYIKTQKTEKGFKIENFLESVTRCYYDFYFEIENEKIYLTAREYNCYNPGSRNSDADNKYYKKLIDKLNIRDYVKIPNVE